MNKRKTFVFIYTFTCPAACRHCCFACSPARTEKMDPVLAEQIINSPYFMQEFQTVSFSGGEVFLYFDEITRLMETAKDHYNIQCITNGFWGSDPVQAEKMIRRLKKCGLTCLVISYDEFHAEFIPVSSIQTILRLCKKYLLAVEVQIAACQSSWRLADTAQVLLKSITEISVSEAAVLLVGAAKENLDEKDLIYEDKTVRERCLGSDAITIFPDGGVYSCCSPVSYSIPYLRQGTLRFGMDDTQMRQVIENDSLFRSLVKYGVNGTCRRRWPSYPVSQKEQYVNVCDLCLHTLSQIPYEEE